MEKPKKQDNTAAGLPIGLCLGTGIGAALGILTKNIGLWLPIGAGFGLAVGLALGPVFGKKEDEETAPDGKEEEP